MKIMTHWVSEMEWNVRGHLVFKRKPFPKSSHVVFITSLCHSLLHHVRTVLSWRLSLQIQFISFHSDLRTPTPTGANMSRLWSSENYCLMCICVLSEILIFDLRPHLLARPLAVPLHHPMPLPETRLVLFFNKTSLWSIKQGFVCLLA